MIKQIGLLLCGRQILLITCMITDRIGLHLVLLPLLIVLIQVYNWEIRHHSLVCRCGLADILYILESFFKPYIQYVTSMHHASKTHVEVFLLNLRYEARYETTTTTTNKQIIDNA